MSKLRQAPKLVRSLSARAVPVIHPALTRSASTLSSSSNLNKKPTPRISRASAAGTQSALAPAAQSLFGGSAGATPQSASAAASQSTSVGAIAAPQPNVMPALRPGLGVAASHIASWAAEFANVDLLGGFGADHDAESSSAAPAPAAPQSASAAAPQSAVTPALRPGLGVAGSNVASWADSFWSGSLPIGPTADQDAEPVSAAPGPAAPQPASAAAPRSKPVRTPRRSSEAMLAVGSDSHVQGAGYPPSGEYGTNHAQVFPNDQLGSPDHHQQQLALPGDSDADTVYRLIPQEDLDQTVGEVEPQGPSVEGSDTSQFPTDSTGGGLEIHTPKANWRRVAAARAAHEAAGNPPGSFVPPIERERIAKGTDKEDTH